MPLVHVDDLGGLLARVALEPRARGIFHATEPGFESKATALTVGELARLCSEAAGRGGLVEHVPKDPQNYMHIFDQTLGCRNAEPRLAGSKFRRAGGLAEYLAAKDGWRRRNLLGSSKL